MIPGAEVQIKVYVRKKEDPKTEPATLVEVLSAQTAVVELPNGKSKLVHLHDLAPVPPPRKMLVQDMEDYTAIVPPADIIIILLKAPMLHAARGLSIEG